MLPFFYTMINIKTKNRPLVKKTKWILVILLPLQWLFINLIKDDPNWIEFNYSLNIYPFFFNLQAFFLKYLPFSFGDLAYAMALVYVIWSLGIFFKRQIKIYHLLLNLLASTSLLSILFHLHWGLNYYRLPLHEKLNYKNEYTQEELEKTLGLMIQSTNELHASLSNEDSVAVQIPYSKEKIILLIEEHFDFDLYNFKTQPYLKNSLWSIPLSYMGFAGYLNPLTLESQINSKIPKLSYITTATHEMAHQLGIASESEANFVAFYTSSKHPDPFIQYAAYSFAIRYCYAELYKADSEKAKNKLSKLNTGVLKNYQKQSSFWSKFQNPFEPYFKKGYDTYLKANGQTKGIQSYNAMVSMLIAHTLANESTLP